jgi:hypothetical protein
MNEPSPDGRSLDGRFAPGNVISQGNLGNKRMKELRRALLDSATPEDVQEVGKALLEMATGGDVQAARVWLEFMVGKPPQAVELSGPDGQALGMEVMMSAVLTALAPYPEARLAVAAKLKGLPRGHDDGPGDGAGDPA